MFLDNWGFPFRNIKKDSRIIIYGLGMVGKSYIYDVEKTDYCKIIAVSDRNPQVDSMGYMYVKPEHITELQYDNIVIAIDSTSILTTMFEMLIAVGVPSGKITSGYANSAYLDCGILKEKCYSTESGHLQVAVGLHGGLGDYVSLLAFVRKLVELDSTIILDLYGIEAFINAVFEGEKYIHRIYNSELTCFQINELAKNYDVLIDLVQFPLIIFWNDEKVKNISPALYERLKISAEDKKIMDLKNNTENHLSIYHRSKLLNYNRYSFLGQGDIWNLKISDSRLHINDNYSGVFKNLKLGKYITFNYGASKAGIGNQKQTKVWRQDYYEQLIKSVHNEYKNIQIVQLGDKYAPIFSESDHIILDAELSLVKHILKNSLLHIDGEGGLVHLATQLGTKCIVLFGPTPEWYYGYPQNINIVSPVCAECCHVFPNWYTTCILGDDVPRCMSAITPEMVMARFREEMNKKLN